MNNNDNYVKKYMEMLQSQECSSLEIFLSWKTNISSNQSHMFWNTYLVQGEDGCGRKNTIYLDSFLLQKSFFQ